MKSTLEFYEFLATIKRKDYAQEVRTNYARTNEMDKHTAYLNELRTNDPCEYYYSILVVALEDVLSNQNHKEEDYYARMVKLAQKRYLKCCDLIGKRALRKKLLTKFNNKLLCQLQLY